MNKPYISLNDSWQNFRINLLESLPEVEVEAWGESLAIVDCSPGEITFSGLNRFFSEYVKVKYQHQFRTLIQHHFAAHIGSSNLGNSDFKIYFKQANRAPESPRLSKSKAEQIRRETGLYVNYNFQRFINGANTDIAHAAALAVIDNIAEPKYNPLFICGAVGLGKTHLMQAIGLQVSEKKKISKIWYSSAEGFTNDLIEGIRYSKTDEIRRKYRSLDLLLIDDIQFLENKHSTQEEFFHTLNELILANKQVVITADRYPREIKAIEERLTSRFASGMVAKIEMPDFETRCAILKNEVELKKLKIDDEVITHIAHTVKSNVRDLIGILTKLEAENSLLGLELTLEAARIILKDVLDLDKSPKSVEDVIKTVAAELGVRKADIISEKRDRDISHARQVGMYIAREITDLSYPVIGRHFDKNHTSVIQACKRVKIMMEENSEFRQMVNSISRKIEQD